MRRLLILLPLGAVCLVAADLGEAKRLMETRRIPEARPILEQITTTSPNDAEALFLLGSCQLQMLEFEPALETLQKAASLAPDNADIQARLGSSYLMEAGRKSSYSYVRKGRAALERALKLNANHVEAIEASIGFYANAPFLVGGDKDKARELVARLKAINPDQGLREEIGLLVQDKKYDAALLLCETSLAKQPESYAALYEFGRLCGMASKRQAEGLKALNHCLALTPPQGSPGHDGAHFRIAVLHKQLGQPEEATRHFDEALRLSNGNPEMAKRVAKAR